MANILIVDDKASMRKMLKEALEDQGHQCKVAGAGSEALLMVKKGSFDVVLSDLRMPELDGMDLLRALKSQGADSSVILMTAYGSVETAVEAMRLGASDFLTKPFSLEHLRIVIDKALGHRSLRAENLGLKTQVADGYKFEGVEGFSRAMKKVHQLIRKVAPTESAVLIQGESGTGKELIAEAIHVNSKRKDKPFLKVNCAALAQGVLESELFGHERGAFTGAHQRRLGRFELANGGSLFLDEIGDMGLDSQVRLLRVLQQKEFERVGGTQAVRVDVRVIAASNKDLKQAVVEGRFREDLYFRLNVVPVSLPSLRDRREEIAPLARFFIEKHGPKGPQAPRLDAAAEAALGRYLWPGNVRELENAIQRALVLADGASMIRPEHLPSELVEAHDKKSRRIGGFNRQVEDLEHRLLADALQKAGGSQTKAAQELGISRTLLIYKMKKHKLKPESAKGSKAKPRAKKKAKR